MTTFANAKVFDGTAMLPGLRTVTLDGNRIASGSFDNTIRVWDAENGKFLLELKGHTRGVTHVSFSPDGTQIASGSGDSTIRVWDANSGQILRELKGYIGRVNSVNFCRVQASVPHVGGIQNIAASV